MRNLIVHHIYTKAIFTIIVILLMSSQKVRLIISTNTNIKFLTAIPAAFTIERAFPLILDRYQTVIA